MMQSLELKQQLALRPGSVPLKREFEVRHETLPLPGRHCVEEATPVLWNASSEQPIHFRANGNSCALSVLRNAPLDVVMLLSPAISRERKGGKFASVAVQDLP